MKKNKEEKDNVFKIFIRYYKYAPGFKELIKLSLGFTFLLVLLVCMIGTNNQYKNKKVSTTTINSTTTTSSISYIDILNNLLKNEIKVSYKINVNNINYSITYTYNNLGYEGYIETDEYTKHFKIKNGEIYEIKMENEILNNNLFSNLNKDYIIMDNLINILKNNDFTKQIENEDTIYNYNNMEVYIKNNKITNIKIDDSLNKYDITIN